MDQGGAKSKKGKLGKIQQTPSPEPLANNSLPEKHQEEKIQAKEAREEPISPACEAVIVLPSPRKHTQKEKEGCPDKRTRGNRSEHQPEKTLEQ